MSQSLQLSTSSTVNDDSSRRKLADYCSKFRGTCVEPKLPPKKKIRTAETMTARAKKVKAPARPGLEIVNGQMVIRPLEIGGGFESDEEDDREEVDEDTGTTSTYSSFTNRTKTERWGIDETRRFYTALRQCGTDFTLMLTQFPGRTQKQLKNKFKNENKNHPELISKALDPKSAIPLNVDPYVLLFEVTSSEETSNPSRTDAAPLAPTPATDTVFDSALDSEADLFSV